MKKRMKILLPVESIADSRLIVEFVLNYHWPEESSFLLLTVLGGMATEEDYLRAEEAASAMLAEVAAALKSQLATNEIECRVTSGDATLEVVSAASRWKADMIVMGYRVRSDISSLLAGSVSRGVALQAPCSVAIIRPSQSGEDEDLTASDGLSATRVRV
ncbi:MAG: universal stress protein [Cyanobacteria bacterium SZAS TMP-1]|nr:universal stress protein [Cyanobacteria bacterium SZAS TMP-1]